ncbi:MAG: hypothetical protein ABJA90_01575 [Ginsengibacter sp.]
MKILDRISFSSYFISPKNLSVYRIIYCLLILTFSGLRSYAWIGNDFDYLFDPPKISIANIFNDFPGNNFFIVLTILNVILFFLMFCGLWTKYTSILFSLTCILGANFIYSFGKIDHNILVLITPLIGGLAGWGNYYSIDERRNRSKIELTPRNREYISFLIAVFALFIGFSFFSAGIVKVYKGWWHINVQAIKYHLYLNYYYLGRDKYLAGYFLRFNSVAFWKFLDYFIIFFELGFLVSVFNRKVFQYFLVSAVVFHFIVLLIYNINFSGNLLVYLLFIDWDKLTTYLKRHFKLNSIKYFIIIYASFMLILWIIKFVSEPKLVELPSFMDFFLPAINLPTLADDISAFISIPVLFFILFIHLQKKKLSTVDK